MKFIVFSLCVFVFCISLYEAKDFVVGTRTNNLLISTEKVNYSSILFIKRDKDYTYVDRNQRIIKGIIARDLSRTDTEVTVTSGGVGASNVTLHFKTGRGQEINYLVLIFSNNR